MPSTKIEPPHTRRERKINERKGKVNVTGIKGSTNLATYAAIISDSQTSMRRRRDMMYRKRNRTGSLMTRVESAGERRVLKK